MKKKCLPLLLAVCLLACNHKKGIPDLSGSKVEISIERFDEGLFSIDTNHIQPGLQKLRQDHPSFYDDFMQQILGVSGSDTSQRTVSATREFLSAYSGIYNSLREKYRNTDWLKKELERAFAFVRYYFPSYTPGKVILFVGPFDAPGVASINAGLAVGLQQFAGRNFPAYQSPQLEEIFPQYISRRFSPEHITSNCMKAVILDLFPEQVTGKPLIEQMLEKGKQWYLLDKFLPGTPDSIKTGYTRQQLDWCTEYEGLIWSSIIKNEDLNSINPTVIQTYIGEAPFTQGFSQEESPGNLGPWIGWQIIKKFAEKNPDMTPAEIMKTPARKILEEAKYKPK